MIVSSSYFHWFPGQQDATYQTSQVLLVWIKNKCNIRKSWNTKKVRGLQNYFYVASGSLCKMFDMKSAAE